MLFNEKRHLTGGGISALCAGMLSPDERLKAAEHIAQCPVCSSLLATALEPQSCPPLPEGFSERLLSKMKTPKTDSRQFFFYSLRVSVAACAALVILYSGVLNRLAAIDSKALKLPDLHAVTAVVTQLSDFSDKIINMEVFTNEKEKK